MDGRSCGSLRDTTRTGTSTASTKSSATSQRRSAFPRPERWVNYVEDSVKATVDAYTGKLQLYQVGHGPVIEAWSKIYPGLFLPADQMPKGVAQQLTYPTQLFHVQFDDLYIYYHMRDPMYFFNMDDMWETREVMGRSSSGRPSRSRSSPRWLARPVACSRPETQG